MPLLLNWLFLRHWKAFLLYRSFINEAFNFIGLPIWYIIALNNMKPIDCFMSLHNFIAWCFSFLLWSYFCCNLVSTIIRTNFYFNLLLIILIAILTFAKAGVKFSFRQALIKLMSWLTFEYFFLTCSSDLTLRNINCPCFFSICLKVFIQAQIFWLSIK